MPDTPNWTTDVTEFFGDIPMVLDKETLKDLDVTENEAADVKGGALSGLPTVSSAGPTCVVAK